jgi:reverse gyrase
MGRKKVIIEKVVENVVDEIEEDNEEKEEIPSRYGEISRLFPNIRFNIIGCFKTVEEIENKILNDTDDTIIIHDEYIIKYLKKEDKNKNITYNDFYIVERPEGKQYITYKDVIDVLIKEGFYRDDCEYKYLWNIVEINKQYKKRCEGSSKVYGMMWSWFF